MIDIVERLRELASSEEAPFGFHDPMAEAADEIERLRAALQQSRSAVTDDMVERAARAIVKRNWPSADPMSINEMWDGYAPDAKAALDAALSQESADA